MTPYLLGLFVLLIVFVVLVLVKTVRIIPQARAGIVERFGKYKETLPAGLNVVVPFVLQILLAGGASVAMLALVRPSVVKRLHSGPDLQLGHGKLVGRQALVTEDVTSLTPGRVKLAGEIWSAQPYDDTLTIKAGETVEVLAMRGATVYVHPVNSTLEP